jgi:glycosyltransferase involved in cell wall biosynthesis
VSIRKPRIGLVVPALEEGGGVPAVAMFIYQVIQRKGTFDCKIVSLSAHAVDEISVCITKPASWFRGIRAREELWQGMRFTRVGAMFSELEFQRYKPRKLLTTLLSDCDLIHIVCGAPAWAHAVTGLGKPVSMHVASRVEVERLRRDQKPQSLKDWWRKGMTEITSWMDDSALHLVEAIQVLNPYMLDYCKAINSGRTNVDIVYAPPGLDTKLFQPITDRQLVVDQYILCVGRLDDPRKNICLLLQAFHLLPPSLSHLKLITAGAHPPQEYWSLVESMGLQERVSHVMQPEMSELIKLYQQATVFALPSVEEGFGMVIIEAMACGVPVVATRCGGPDSIITDGKDGYLVPMNDAPAMADAITRLCTDGELNEFMGHEARAKVEAKYASEMAGQILLDAWDRILLNTKISAKQPA